MAGKVYPHGKAWRVRFRGTWFTRDEHGRVFKAEFYATSFLNLLNALYHPDPARNRYDPKKFKDRTPHHFDGAFQVYLDSKPVRSSYQEGKTYAWDKYFKPYFKNQDFRTIDKVQLDAFKIWLQKKNLKGHTIKNIFTILHGFLNHYRSAFNLFPEWPDLKYQKPKIKWAADPELDQIFEFIEGKDRPYFWSIRGFGLRPEEASGLLQNAVNWMTMEILVKTVFVDGQMKDRTKNEVERTVPIDLDPEAMKYMRHQDVKNRERKDSVLFFSVEGKPYTRHIRERRWNVAMDQAEKKYGTRRITLRNLRHSAATRWRLKKVPLDLIRRLLGHSTQDITDAFYADVDVHQVVEMVRK